MTQADAQDRYPARECRDQRDRDPGLLRRARAGRQDDLLDLAALHPGDDLLDGDLVIADDVHFGAEFPEVLVQVEGK